VPASRLRLKILRTCYPHWGRYTGMHQFLRFLPADRYEIDESMVNDGDEDFPITSKAVRNPLRRIVQRKGMTWYRLSDLAAETRATLLAVGGRIDLLHYLDGEHSAQYFPRLRRALALGRTRVVASFHQPADLLPTLVRSDVVARLDGVTLVSPTQRPFFEPILPPERIAVILHGIDTDFFRPGGVRPADGVFRCITVGHYLRDYQAIGRVAESMVSDPSVRFIVVSARDTGLERMTNVEHQRGVGDESLLRLYQSADALLLPLTASTANNALLEGIACGLPVISTALASVRTYLPGEEAILVERNEPDLLIPAIHSLRDDPAERSRRSILARRRAEELAWPRIAPQFDQLYQRLVG
jgi:glycosyltransferase involved in cell wall biosynthesis